MKTLEELRSESLSQYHIFWLNILNIVTELKVEKKTLESEIERLKAQRVKDMEAAYKAGHLDGECFVESNFEHWFKGHEKLAHRLKGDDKKER